mmetsp:Transcript_61661/g.170553  ORF Transcript_61661/g.170553 Transcript_61661/m.170553 type:complete len:740 (-) Transcript_61661:213-2432(-)
MKDYSLKKVFSVGLLAVIAVHAFCPVNSFVPIRQDWRRNLPTSSLVPTQQDVYFSQQKGRSPSARAATTFSAAIPTYTSPQTAGTIQDLLLFTNEERRRQGLSELRYNKELEKAAQRHAGDMAKNNYFSHDGLNGSDLKDRVATTEYRYTNVGENLFWRTPDNDPSYAVQGWMESQSHRKNMLDPQFTEIGLGYAVDPTNAKHYYVQVFGRPLETPNVRASPQDTRQSIFLSTNEARQLQGLPPFGMSSELTQGAQEHAEDMMRSGQLTSKLKRGSYDRFFTNVGARFAAREVFNDPLGAVQGWLEKGPQSDILSERFTETGIGYATDGEQHYYVQLFGTPMETGVGRRDFTGSGSPSRVGMVAPGMGAPQQDKKEDKARNGDFGRMGFGGNNRERRQDGDEVDDQWMDDKKVMQAIQNRRPIRRARMSDMGRRNNGGQGLKPTGSDGFNDDWNRDYAGTANIREFELGPGNGMMRRPRGMMPGGGGAGPIPMRSQQDMMNPSDPRYQLDRPQGMYGLDRRMNSNNGFSNGPGSLDRGQSQNSNGRQRRRNTPSAFAGQSSRQDRNGESNGSVNAIHFQRHQQQMGGMGMMGMDEEMMYGPPPPGMRGQGLYGRNQMAGPGMYGMNGRSQMREPGMYGLYNRNQMREPGMYGLYNRSQMRDPTAYGRYDFGQPPQQHLGPRNDYMRGPSNIGMGANSEFGRGEYYAGQYSYRNGVMDRPYGGGYGMRARVGLRADEFGP